MDWTFAPCACCNDSIMLPGDVARRVMDGTSHVLCEACMELPLFELEDPGDEND